MPGNNSSIETRVYDQEYYSGAQVNVYISDVLIDEITGLEVSVQQRKQPIYGYADQLFSKVARGTVMVEGSFSINFKEAGYLYAVLERLKRKNDGTRPNFSPHIQANTINQLRKDKTPLKGGAGGGFVRRQNIEQIKQQQFVDQVTNGKNADGTPLRPEDLIEAYRSLSGFSNPVALSSALSRASGNNANLEGAEGVFEKFEDKIWSTANRLEADSEGRRGDSNIFDDFTIYVTFGDHNRSDYVNHTAKRIDNVHLIGQAQTITINEEPVAEVYRFIARNYV